MADILFISLQAMDRSVPQKYSRFFFFFLSTYREQGGEFLCGVAIDLILIKDLKVYFSNKLCFSFDSIQKVIHCPEVGFSIQVIIMNQNVSS